MRLSFVLDTFLGGGKERRCLQFIQGLNKEGIVDIQVIIVNNGIAYPELYETTARIDIINRKEKRLGIIKTARALYGLLKNFRPDVVQAWGIMSAGVVVLVRPFFKFRFIASYVADVIKPKGINGIINHICNLVCDLVVANSRAGLIAYGTPESKGLVIYNGFNETRFNNRADKSSKKIALGITTEFVIAMVASFGETKDWQCYFDSAKRILQERKDITFIAVGDGPQWDFFNNQISGGYSSNIKMLGRRNDVDEIYQLCDLTLLCSFGEGLSNSILESMAWGVPVLASPFGGTPEIIEDGVNGVLIECQTPEWLSGKILSLIDNLDLLSMMGEKAAETVRSRFLLQRMTRDYLGLYKQIQ